MKEIYLFSGYSFVLCLLVVGIFLVLRILTYQVQESADVAICGVVSTHAHGPHWDQEWQGNAEHTFKSRCASCHKLHKRLTGPKLAGVGEKYEMDWLKKWIRSNNQMIEDGEPMAVALYHEYAQMNCMSFPNLTDQEIEDLIASN